MTYDELRQHIHDQVAFMATYTPEPDDPEPECPISDVSVAQALALVGAFEAVGLPVPHVSVFDEPTLTFTLPAGDVVWTAEESGEIFGFMMSRDLEYWPFDDNDMTPERAAETTRALLAGGARD